MPKFRLLSALILGASILLASTAPTMNSDVSASTPSVGHLHLMHTRENQADQEVPTNIPFSKKLEMKFKEIEEELIEEGGKTRDGQGLLSNKRKILAGLELHVQGQWWNSHLHEWRFNTLYPDSRDTLEERLATFKIKSKARHGNPPRAPVVARTWAAQAKGQLEYWEQKKEDAQNALESHKAPSAATPEKTLYTSLLEIIAPTLAQKKAKAAAEAAAVEARIQAAKTLGDAENMYERVKMQQPLAEWINMVIGKLSES